MIESGFFLFFFFLSIWTAVQAADDLLDVMVKYKRIRRSKK